MKVLSNAWVVRGTEKVMAPRLHSGRGMGTLETGIQSRAWGTAGKPVVSQAGAWQVRGWRPGHPLAVRACLLEGRLHRLEARPLQGP